MISTFFALEKSVSALGRQCLFEQAFNILLIVVEHPPPPPPPPPFDVSISLPHVPYNELKKGEYVNAEIKVSSSSVPR